MECAHHCTRCGTLLQGTRFSGDEPASGTSTDVGPSFFARTDPFPSDEERGGSNFDRSDLASDEEEKGSLERSWRAAAVLSLLLMLGVLGWREWRARSLPPHHDGLLALYKSSLQLPGYKEPTAPAHRSKPAAPQQAVAVIKKPPEAVERVKERKEGASHRSGESGAGVTPLAAGVEKDEAVGEVSSVSAPLKLVGAKDDATASPTTQLERAAAKGDPNAPVRLANMYLNGEGVERSCEQALALLQSAVTKPNVRALNRLALLYEVGVCVQRDRVQAYRWLTLALAADPRDEWAQQNRDLTWNQMSVEERLVVTTPR